MVVVKDRSTVAALMLHVTKFFLPFKCLQVLQALEDKTKRARVLASITALKKLCNHPKVISSSSFHFIIDCHQNHTHIGHSRHALD